MRSRLWVGGEGAEPVRPRRRPWKALLVQERALRSPPAYWALNVRMVVLGTRESRLGPVACGRGKRCPSYNRRRREAGWAAERRSERVVVLGGRESRPRGEGPALHRCTRRR